MILQPLYLRSVYHATSLRPKRMLIFSVLLVGLTILVFVHLDFYSVEMRTMTPRSKSQDLYKFDSASSLTLYTRDSTPPHLFKNIIKRSHDSPQWLFFSLCDLII
ncbi:unnamed protein product [Allacma fusca]|uniref:Uncharacterized protein n=1 Tax=Allacma fusca TaxID=39272 RepID=A0A8J2KLG7_9HEXA|nr:unnamed protein product [Allacma fusca]